jgi:hypothetical protein
VKEFLKIFLVLCAIVSAFFFGRNYGEVTKTESSEFKTMKSDNFNNQNAQTELNNLKDKFQKLLDSSDLKKADEILGQVMTIFLADLSLQLSEQKQKEFDEGKKLCSSNAIINQVAQKAEPAVENKALAEAEEKPAAKAATRLSARFKMGEFEMSEARDVRDIRKALSKLEVKKIDTLLDGAPVSTFQQSKAFFGTYRGSIIDVTGNAYGSIIFNIQNVPSESQPIKGSIQLYKNGEIMSNSNFTTDSIGSSPINSSATVLNVGPKHFLQVYKIEYSQKIAGIYYEQLPNRTTKTIGTFILSRTDFVD